MISVWRCLEPITVSKYPVAIFVAILGEKSQKYQRRGDVAMLCGDVCGDVVKFSNNINAVAMWRSFPPTGRGDIATAPRDLGSA